MVARIEAKKLFPDAHLTAVQVTLSRLLWLLLLLLKQLLLLMLLLRIQRLMLLSFALTGTSNPMVFPIFYLHLVPCRPFYAPRVLATARDACMKRRGKAGFLLKVFLDTLLSGYLDLQFAQVKNPTPIK